MFSAPRSPDPPVLQPGVDYYKEFGLEFGASDEEIKKRHKELALKCVCVCARAVRSFVRA